MTESVGIIAFMYWTFFILCVLYINVFKIYSMGWTIAPIKLANITWVLDQFLALMHCTDVSSMFFILVDVEWLTLSKSVATQSARVGNSPGVASCMAPLLLRQSEYIFTQSASQVSMGKPYIMARTWGLVGFLIQKL